MNRFSLISKKNFLFYLKLRVDAIAVRIVSGEEIRTFSRPEYKRTNDLLLDILKGVGGPRDPIEYLTACSYYIPL